jgi:hypothetical protein
MVVTRTIQKGMLFTSADVGQPASFRGGQDNTLIRVKGGVQMTVKVLANTLNNPQAASVSFQEPGPAHASNDPAADGYVAASAGGVETLVPGMYCLPSTVRPQLFALNCLCLP